MQVEQEFRELGDDHHTVLASYIVGFIHHQLGERELARDLYQVNLRRAREIHDIRVEARALAQGAVVLGELGQIQEALSLLEQAYAIDRKVGEAVQAALDMCRFARVLAAAGLTVIPVWLPVMLPVPVSVAVSERLPAVFKVALKEWLPASLLVKV